MVLHDSKFIYVQNLEYLKKTIFNYYGFSRRMERLEKKEAKKNYIIGVWKIK